MSLMVSSFVVVILLLQQFVQIGKAAVQAMPPSFSFLVELISFLSGLLLRFRSSRLFHLLYPLLIVLALNFDVTVAKPGCSVPSFSFASTFWTTLLAVLIWSVFLILAAWFRALYLGSKIRPSASYYQSPEVELMTASTASPDTNPSSAPLNEPAPLLSTQEVKSDDVMTFDSSSNPSSPSPAPSAPSQASPDRPLSIQNNFIQPSASSSSSSTTTSSSPVIVSVPVASSPTERASSPSPTVSPPPPTGLVFTRIDERLWAKSSTDIFKARLQHSLLIMGCMLYLKIITLSFFAVNCVDAPGMTGIERDSSSLLLPFLCLLYLLSFSSWLCRRLKQRCGSSPFHRRFYAMLDWRTQRRRGFCNHLTHCLWSIFDPSPFPPLTCSSPACSLLGFGFPLVCFIILRNHFKTRANSVVPLATDSTSSPTVDADGHKPFPSDPKDEEKQTDETEIDDVSHQALTGAQVCFIVSFSCGF
jgi:hypothetical protein